MARRLAVLLTRNLVTSTSRVHQRTLALPCCAGSEGYVNRVPLLAGNRVPLLAGVVATTCHHYSTEVTESTDEVVEEPPGIFKRMWRWLLDSDDMDTDYKMSPEERQERDDIMLKVQEMYFASPPIEPDVETYKDVMAVLIKYDDRHGVETLWRVMPEMKVEPDEELTSIVTTFLEETKDKEYLQ